MTIPKECPKCGLLMALAECVEENPAECAVCYMKRKRHFNDPPTISEMLDKMEEKRTVDAVALVAALRTACAALYEYQGSGVADDALQSIERGLWATCPSELWFEEKP